MGAQYFLQCRKKADGVNGSHKPPPSTPIYSYIFYFSTITSNLGEAVSHVSRVSYCNDVFIFPNFGSLKESDARPQV